MAEIISTEVEDALVDLKRGLHLAMTALIQEEDAEGAESYLRQVDQRLTSLINRVKVIRA